MLYRQLWQIVANLFGNKKKEKEICDRIFFPTWQSSPLKKTLHTI
jgi:hypothetical protein